MKYIFLDIDGVLNSAPFLRKMKLEIGAAFDQIGQHSIDPVAVKLLNTVVDDTGCTLVVSSIWRYMFPFQKLKDILVSAGLYLAPGTELQMCPILNFDKGWEIRQFISDQNFNEQDDTYVVIDDDSSLKSFFNDQCVLTSMQTGLISKNVLEIMAILKK